MRVWNWLPECSNLLSQQCLRRYYKEGKTISCSRAYRVSKKIVIPNLLSNIVFLKVLLNPKKYNSFCKVACRVGNLKKKESKILKKTSFLVNSIVEILVSYKFIFLFCLFLFESVIEILISYYCHGRVFLLFFVNLAFFLCFKRIFRPFL